jgi:rare lipoprotein A (peptidoglycan hydrolase)
VRHRFFAPLLCLALALAGGCVPIRQGIRPGQGGEKVSSTGTKSPTSDSQTHPVASSTGSSAKPAVSGGSVRKEDAWKNELEGLASWYGVDFNGRLTASGEVYDMYEMTAAHKTLPLGSVVKVHNLDNGKSITVRVNDRGPYVEGRVIDLSRKAARALGMRDQGTAPVRLEVLSMPKK